MREAQGCLWLSREGWKRSGLLRSSGDSGMGWFDIGLGAAVVRDSSVHLMPLL